MGGCPTGTAPGSFPRGGRKRGLQTDLQNEIVQEIEDLLARQSIADLDLEALEVAARCQALRLAARALEQRLNTDTCDYVGPELPCPCARKKSQTARASKPTARPKPAKPSWSLSGRRNREIGKANPCAIQDRSAIRVRLKAPPLRIPAPTCRILPRAYSARPAAAVSPKPCVRWCWAMARPGFGTRLPNCSRKPLRFSIAFMPKNISAKWERSFMEIAPRVRHGSMHGVRSLTKVT